jgi:hypothetical protein
MTAKAEWRCNSDIIDLGTRRTSMVSFLPRLLCPRGNRKRYRFDSRLVGTKKQFGHYGEGNLSLPRIKLVVFRYVDWVIPALYNIYKHTIFVS